MNVEKDHWSEDHAGAYDSFQFAGDRVLIKPPGTDMEEEFIHPETLTLRYRVTDKFVGEEDSWDWTVTPPQLFIQFHGYSQDDDLELLVGKHLRPLAVCCLAMMI